MWEAELHRDLGPAPFGENLTTERIDVSGALVGERWRIGTTLLDPAFLKRFAFASRPGAYLRIVGLTAGLRADGGTSQERK